MICPSNPKYDKRPNLSHKEYWNIIKNIQANDKDGFESIEDYVKMILQKYKMKDEYKYSIIQELNNEFNKKMRDGQD